MKKAAAKQPAVWDINSWEAVHVLWKDAFKESRKMSKKQLLAKYVKAGILTRAGRLTKNYGG